jgi:hypothetical protein
MLYSVGFKQKFLIYGYILKVFQLKVYIKILSDSCVIGSQICKYNFGLFYNNKKTRMTLIFLLNLVRFIEKKTSRISKLFKLRNR